MDKKINDFIVFCMENYKEKERLTGKQVFKLFNEYGVLDYLSDGYEVLHTQGKEWIMNDIDEFLSVRGYNKLG